MSRLVQGVLTFIEVQLIIKLMHFMGSLYRSAAIIIMSEIIGSLADYFTIGSSSSDDTRNA